MCPYISQMPLFQYFCLAESSRSLSSGMPAEGTDEAVPCTPVGPPSESARQDRASSPSFVPRTSFTKEGNLSTDTAGPSSGSIPPLGDQNNLLQRLRTVSTIAAPLSVPVSGE